MFIHQPAASSGLNTHTHRLFSVEFNNIYVEPCWGLSWQRNICPDKHTVLLVFIQEKKIGLSLPYLNTATWLMGDKKCSLLSWQKVKNEASQFERKMSIFQFSPKSNRFSQSYFIFIPSTIIYLCLVTTIYSCLICLVGRGKLNRLLNRKLIRKERDHWIVEKLRDERRK